MPGARRLLACPVSVFDALPGELGWQGSWGAQHRAEPRLLEGAASGSCCRCFMLHASCCRVLPRGWLPGGCNTCGQLHR